MTAAVGAVPATEPAAAESAVTWSYDPWRERPGIATLAAASALGLCALVVLLREPLLVSAGLIVFCIAAFAPALSPVECRLDADGPARRGPLGWERRRWADIRRAEPLPAGVFLSPYPRRHWLDAQRGLTLPMPGARRDELRAAVVRFREAHGGRRD